MKKHIDGLNGEEEKLALKTLRKEELDQFIGYAIKEGHLDEDMAREMSYEDKEDYFGWSEAQANK